jgi:hypothetical protein
MKNSYVSNNGILNETLQMEKLILIFIPQFVIVTQYVMYYEMIIFSK